MGYRSHVLAVVHVSDLISFNELLAKHALEDWFRPTNLTDTGKAPGSFIEFELVDRVKWYESYLHIQALEKFFEGSIGSSAIVVGEANETQIIGEKEFITFHEVMEVSAEYEDPEDFVL